MSVTAGAQLLPNLGGRREGPQVTFSHPFPAFPVPGSWSWKTGRADCSRSSGSAWQWKVRGMRVSCPRGGWAWAPWPYRPRVLYCCPDHLKTEEELSEEKKILNEMLEVVEQRDALVALLEEQRLREREEDKDLEAVMLSKGFSLNWS